MKRHSRTRLIGSLSLALLCACHQRYVTRSPGRMLHPLALPNQHGPGEVDRPELVPFSIPDPNRLPGIIIDETEAQLQGDWQYSTHTPPYVGRGYLHDQKSGKGLKSVTYPIQVPRAGWYEVRLSHDYNIRRATNTWVRIKHARGTFETQINQQQIPEHNRLFRTIGTFSFLHNIRYQLVISNEGTEGKYVIADAIQLIRLHSDPPGREAWPR